MSFFERNAYHVLGLDTSASQKEISRRANEITTRLKIDDVPAYDMDLDVFSGYRNDESVKEAVSNLSNPKRQIKEYFFWFQVADSVDEQAIGLLRSNEYEEAIRVWEHHSSDETAKSTLYKKNLAVLLSVLMYKENNEDYLSKSLKLWKELIESDKFWKSFEKIYRLHDELGAEDGLTDKLKLSVEEGMSDIYTELSIKYSDNEYAASYAKVFGLKGKKFEKEVIDPIYTEINKVIDTLESLKMSEGETFGDKEKVTVKNLIVTAQDEFNKLVDLDVYESSQVKTIRDRFSNALRVIVLDVHNNLDDFATAAKFLEVAILFCGTDSLKSKLQQEMEQINKNLDGAVENTIILEIPSTFQTHYLKADLTSLEYEDRKILYKNAIKVSWHSSKSSINGIPSGQSYSFAVSDETYTMRINFSAAFRGGEKHNETFGKLVGLSNAFVEPVVVKKLLSRIFDKGETITIGKLYLNKDGFHKDKVWGPVEEIKWADVKFIPKLHQGNAHVFSSNKKGKAVTFLSIPMSTANAVVIPDLITECLKLHTK